MTLLVDTSVWPLAFRRDGVQRQPEVLKLRQAIDDGEPMVTVGFLVQELLHGFAGPRAHRDIVDRLAAMPLLIPDRDDHIEAAALRNVCRRGGVQLGTVDTLIARLCIRHRLTLLTADQDFDHASAHCALTVWRPRNI